MENKQTHLPAHRIRQHLPSYKNFSAKQTKHLFGLPQTLSNKKLCFYKLILKTSRISKIYQNQSQRGAYKPGVSLVISGCSINIPRCLYCKHLCITLLMNFLLGFIFSGTFVLVQTILGSMAENMTFVLGKLSTKCCKSSSVGG